MFGFLKDKLKSVVGSFSKKVAEEAKEVDEPPAKPEPKKTVPPPPKEPPRKEPEKKPEPKKEEKKHEHKAPEPKQEPEKKPEHKHKEPEKKPDHKPQHKKPEHKAPEVNQSVVVPDAISQKIESITHPIELGPLKDDTKLKELAKQYLERKAKEAVIPDPKQEPKSKAEAKQEHKPGFLSRLFGGKPKEEAKPEPPEEKPIDKVEPADKPEQKEEIPAQEPEQKKPDEKKGLFERITERITHKELSEQKFEELFWDLEVTMLENNVAVEVIDKIKADLRTELVGVPIKRSDIDATIMRTLKRSIEELFDVPAFDLLARIEEKKPYVILYLGINGAGKTTTIAKTAHLFSGMGKKVVLAAGDTFRAAAIQQLEQHATKLNLKIIKHEYGSDAAAVAFDAVAFAKSKDYDVVLIDTAGRLHSNTNLMDELRKIVRVAQPDAKIFIGESITGNDCVEQAKQFNDAVGIDGIILSKADVDEKGGAAISVSYVTGKPILFLGVGQEYSDLKPFDARIVIDSLGLS